MSRLQHSVDTSKETHSIALESPQNYQPQHPLFQPAEDKEKKKKAKKAKKQKKKKKKDECHQVNYILNVYTTNKYIPMHYKFARAQLSLEASKLHAFLVAVKKDAALRQLVASSGKNTCYSTVSTITKKEEYENYVRVNNAELIKELKIILKKIQNSHINKEAAAQANDEEPDHDAGSVTDSTAMLAAAGLGH